MPTVSCAIGKPRKARSKSLSKQQLTQIERVLGRILTPADFEDSHHGNQKHNRHTRKQTLVDIL